MILVGKIINLDFHNHSYREKFEEVPFYHRSSLNPGAAIDGPAVIIENDTSTVVSKRFRARIVRSGCIVMEAKQTV